jgi:hypothetical protein
MALNHVFSKKMMAVVDQINETLSKQDHSADVYARLAQVAINTLSMEGIVANLDEYDLVNDRYPRVLVSVILGSEDYVDEFISMCMLNGSLGKAYELVVRGMDDNIKGITVECYQLTETLSASLRTIIEYHKDSLESLYFPIWSRNASAVFENMAQAVGSAEPILKVMNPVEIAACAEGLDKYGYSIAPGNRKENRYPYYYFREGSREDIGSIFEVMKKFHGGISAQIKISNITAKEKDYIFLSLDDLSVGIPVDKLAFIEKAISSKHRIYSKPLSYVIGAYRNDCRLGELDALDKKHTSYLIKNELLLFSDLGDMPITRNNHKVSAIKHDMGM